VEAPGHSIPERPRLLSFFGEGGFAPVDMFLLGPNPIPFSWNNKACPRESQRARNSILSRGDSGIDDLGLPLSWPELYSGDWLQCSGPWRFSP